MEVQLLCSNKMSESSDKRISRTDVNENNETETKRSANANTTEDEVRGNNSSNSVSLPKVPGTNMKKSEEEYKKDLLEIMRTTFNEEDLPEKFREWDFSKQYNWIMEVGSRKFLEFPETLVYMLPGAVRPGDCGRSPTEKPDWLDIEKFHRGQKFMKDHACGLLFAEVISLFLIFAYENGLNTLVLTGKSHTPYLAFKRYLSTVNRLRNWYTTDPFTKGTSAFKDIQAVRRMHLLVRNHVVASSQEEINAAAKIQYPWCPMREFIVQDFNSAIPPARLGSSSYTVLDPRRFTTKALSQSDMSATQFAFMSIALLYPKAFGIHYATEEDFEGFCHFWRAIGYLLGIEDRYNFCRGDVQEVRDRSRQFLELFMKPSLRTVTPEWEHMSRCVIKGTQYYYYNTSFAAALLYLTELIDIPMKNFYNELNYTHRVLHTVAKFFFYHLCKVPWILSSMNRVLNRCIDRAVNFGPEEHSVIEEKSTKTLLSFTLG